MEWLIERLIGLIPAISNLSREKREIADNALVSISHALNETCIYLKQIRDGSPKNRETEEKLARYWAAAAIPARHLDDEFAELCIYKSDAWVNPDEWNRERIEQYGIDLESVRKKYHDLLLDK